MSSSRLPDHELYARHIFPLGYGYPLWRPTGTRVGRRESDESHAEYCTRVGDVGVLARGGFTTMFNSMAAPEQEGGDSDSDLLPDGFQPLNARNLSMVGAHTVNDPFLCSAGITGVEVSAGSESDASAMAMHAKWTEQSGAVLALATPAYSRTIVSKRRIVEYMKQHHDSWVALAASPDLNVNAGPKGVLFVSGTVTTTACGAFAYSRLAGGGDGQLGVSFDEREGVMRAELDGQEIRSAHGTGTGTGSAGASRGASGGEADRGGRLCVFVHYYKMERRLWWSRAMQAAAGPHELPRGAEDDDEDDFPAYSAGDAECGEEEADERQYVNYDPVDVLLEYILENSEAHSAIASTHDVCELLQMSRPAGLKQLDMALKCAAPRVHIDKDGVGTLLLKETHQTDAPRTSLARIFQGMPVLRGACRPFCSPGLGWESLACSAVVAA